MDFDDIVKGLSDDDDWLSSLAEEIESLGDDTDDEFRFGVEVDPDKLISDEIYDEVKAILASTFLRILLASAIQPDPVAKRDDLKRKIEDYNNMESPIFAFSSEADIREALSKRLVDDIDAIVSLSFEIGAERLTAIRESVITPETITGAIISDRLISLREKASEKQTQGADARGKITRIKLV